MKPKKCINSTCPASFRHHSFNGDTVCRISGLSNPLSECSNYIPEPTFKVGDIIYNKLSGEKYYIKAARDQFPGNVNEFTIFDIEEVKLQSYPRTQFDSDPKYMSIIRDSLEEYFTTLPLDKKVSVPIDVKVNVTIPKTKETNMEKNICYNSKCVNYSIKNHNNCNRLNLVHTKNCDNFIGENKTMINFKEVVLKKETNDDIKINYTMLQDKAACMLARDWFYNTYGNTLEVPMYILKKALKLNRVSQESEWAAWLDGNFPQKKYADNVISVDEIQYWDIYAYIMCCENMSDCYILCKKTWSENSSHYFYSINVRNITEILHKATNTVQGYTTIRDFIEKRTQPGYRFYQFENLSDVYKAIEQKLI